MNKRKGFTLIELIISVAIVGLLASAVFVSVDPGKRLEDAEDAKRWADLTALNKAIEKYTADFGSIPSDFSSSTLAEGEKTVLCSTQSTLSCDGQDRACTIIDDTNFLGKYIGGLPVDPDKMNTTDTGYFMTRGSGNGVVLGVCDNDTIPEIRVNVGSKMTALTIAQYITQTSDTDFNAGATTTAEVAGSGDAGYLSLAMTSGSNGLINNAGAGEYALDVVVDSDYAYVANGTGGFFIYDVSNPASPSYVSDIDNGNSTDIAVYGDYLYASDAARVEVFDISNKVSPVATHTMSLIGTIEDIFVDDSNDVMYVARSRSACAGYCADGWIDAYDLSSDPSHPSLLDTTNDLGYFLDSIFVYDDYLYATLDFYDYDGSRLYWFDISNPSAITQTDYINVSSGYLVDEISTDGEYVYVGVDTEGIKVISTSTDSIVHTYNTAGEATGLFVNNDSLYVADNNATVLNLDISSSTNISENASYSATDSQDVMLSGSYIYVADYSSGLRTIALPAYSNSGDLISSVIDTTANTEFDTISWSGNTPAGTSISMKARTSNDSGMSGATAWGTCTSISNGSDMSSNNCVTDGHRYIQYQATLATTDISTSSLLYDVSIGYVE